MLERLIEKITNDFSCKSREEALGMINALSSAELIRALEGIVEPA